MIIFIIVTIFLEVLIYAISQIVISSAADMMKKSEYHGWDDIYMMASAEIKNIKKFQKVSFVFTIIITTVVFFLIRI